MSTPNINKAYSTGRIISQPVGLATAFVQGKNYVFYITSSSTLSFLTGDDGGNFTDTPVKVSDTAITVSASDGLLAATVNQDIQTSIRVYYTDSNRHIRELIGKISGDQVFWEFGGLTDEHFKVSLGSELTASATKTGTLRVFFVSDSIPNKISEAWYTQASNAWKTKPLW